MRVAICIQEQIYDALKDLLGNLRELPDYCKMQSFGFMDLNLDRLEQRNTTTTIAISHYYKHPSGDMIADPDMEIRIFHELKMAEALSFQDIFGYKRVYHENGYIDAETKTMLNKFLLQWLRNLKAQGFKRPVCRQAGKLKRLVAHDYKSGLYDGIIGVCAYFNNELI